MASTRSATRILILGGTAEARQLAGRLAASAEFDVNLSLAGRTEKPVAHPVPVRVGGFGGPEGLAQHLRESGVDILVDATHPYAAQISANAAEAAAKTGVPIVALRRPPWTTSTADHWEDVDDASAAADRLVASEKRLRVFLALGRQELTPFERAPQHFYLIRSVDPVEPRLILPDAQYIVARGPFEEVDESDLFQTNRIDIIVCKNSGSSATYAKLAAARQLDIRVLMIRRSALPDVPSGETVDEVLAMIDHLVTSVAKKRGV
ncbi:MAG TPA: cobalt-precorrin-6A reductase [Rhizobiaceae bacterium]|nr:cobalt-precorrin-6A reductase [Rhizobiaceae bacterium]